MLTLTTLTAERVREVLDYDRDTGIFTWLIYKGSNAYPGLSTPGSMDGKGYYRLTIDRCMYQAHRIAWLHAHGVWPTIVIDHIDRNPANNRLVNLRDVTFRENNANMRPRIDASGGRSGDAKGCTFRRGRWQAQISTNNGGNRYLGMFATQSDAHEAYKRALALRGGA